jgi:uncharacterized protein (TIGR03067 family)
LKRRFSNGSALPCCASLVFLVCVFCACAAGDEIDDYVRGQMRQHDIPGLALAVLSHGQVSKAAGFGNANIEWDAPVDKDTAFEIGSVTKQFTASAVLLLADEGTVGLDDSVAKYVHDLPRAWQKVTLRQLLTHTSGIRNYQEAGNYSIENNYSFRDLVQLSATLPPTAAPGEKWDYSNTGYVLLGAVIESVSGRSYEAFLQDRFFIPLHMSNTRINDRRAVLAHRASGYSRQNGRWVNVPPQPIATSAGGVVSTGQDMAKWDMALDSDFPLKLSIRRQLWTGSKDSRGVETPYGMGWFVTSVAGRRVVEHSGATPGFSAAVCRSLDDRVTAIVLTNSDNGAAADIARRIALNGVRWPRPATTADSKKSELEGTWRVISAEAGERPVTADDIRRASISFTGGRVVLRNLIPGRGEGTFELDPAAHPKGITLFNGESDDIRGIYELEGDRLKLCFNSGAGKSRPTDFKSTGDRMLLVLSQKARDK